MTNKNLLLTGSSKYDPSIPGRLREYVKTNRYLNTASTYSLASIFGVSRQTISHWMKTHEEFREVVEELRTCQLVAVESAMMKRIIGCTVKETKIVRTEEGTLKQTVEKEVPPDAGLLRFYLAHRAPECWGDPEEQPVRPVEDTLYLNAEDAPEDVA